MRHFGPAIPLSLRKMTEPSSASCAGCSTPNVTFQKPSKPYRERLHPYSGGCQPTPGCHFCTRTNQCFPKINTSTTCGRRWRQFRNSGPRLSRTGARGASGFGMYRLEGGKRVEHWNATRNLRRTETGIVIRRLPACLLMANSISSRKDKHASLFTSHVRGSDTRSCNSS